jgi:DNA gyrase subunit A
MITRMGEIKRTEMGRFENIRSNGLIAFDIEEGDDLNWVLKTRGNDDVILVTREGQSIRFPETAARGRGRAAGGVRAVRFKNDEDHVVSSQIVREGAKLLVIGEHGFGKLTELDEYRIQGRGGSGILTMNVTEKTGKIVGADVVENDDKLMVMTTSGQSIRCPIQGIRVTGRIAQGVKIINLKEGDQVRSIARVVKAADGGDLDSEGEE